MKQQVIAIHGGDTFQTYEEYITFLKNKTVNFEKIRSKGWLDLLGQTLGDTFDVITPLMPNKTNARYLEWKIWFEKLIPHFDENAIFVGRSLGAIFLAKYFSENEYSKKIKALFLVAGPYDTEGSDYTLMDFALEKPVSSLMEKTDKIYIYQSEDDTVVLFENAAKFKKDLPSAILKTFKDRGHFLEQDFPELVEDIKSLK